MLAGALSFPRRLSCLQINEHKVDRDKGFLLEAHSAVGLSLNGQEGSLTPQLALRSPGRGRRRDRVGPAFLPICQAFSAH